jgi:hypothetical protein
VAGRAARRRRGGEHEIAVELNVEAMLLRDLEATGAISYYR